MKLISGAEFLPLKNCLDTRMKELASEGKRVLRKQAAIITLQEEDEMWTKGVLGMDTPSKLVDTLIYMFGLHFALRGGKEQRQLRFKNSQVTLNVDGDGRKYLVYAEDISKCSQGGLKHRKIRPKTVHAYENLAEPSRCIVACYEKYVSLRPSSESCNGAMYLRPLKKPSGDVWFSCQALGIHQLQTTVARLCKEAGLGGYRTNHSLRATSASRLYDSNVDEQLICETTGHRSNSVRSYKRTSAQQLKAKSDILYGKTQAEIPTVSVATKGQPNPVNVTVKISVN